MDFELFGSVEFIKLQLSTKKGEGEATQTLIWEGQQKMTSPSKRRRDCKRGSFSFGKKNFENYIYRVCGLI